MTKYKIEKKTFYGINEYGDIKEYSVFRCYIKVWIFLWDELKTSEMYDTGFIYNYDIGFKTIEEAENFINKYHENRHKVGNYEITTVELINK